jgi:hypothetical protein
MEKPYQFVFVKVYTPEYTAQHGRIVLGLVMGILSGAPAGRRWMYGCGPFLCLLIYVSRSKFSCVFSHLDFCEWNPSTWKANIGLPETGFDLVDGVNQRYDICVVRWTESNDMPIYLRRGLIDDYRARIAR